MAEQQQFRLRVVGAEGNRVKGVLGMVVPQALDLAATTAYTASISEAKEHPRGSLHLRRTDDGIQATWHRNVNLHTAPAEPPAWVGKALTLSRELGRSVTWQPPT